MSDTGNMNQQYKDDESDEPQSKAKSAKGTSKSKKTMKKTKKQKPENNNKYQDEESIDRIEQLTEKVSDLTQQMRSMKIEHKKALDHMKNKLIQQFKKIIEKMQQVVTVTNNKQKQTKKWQPVQLKKIEGVQGMQPRKIRKVQKGEVAARTFSKSMNQEVFFHKNPSDNIPFEPDVLCPVNPQSRYIKRFIITKNQFQLDANDYTILVAKPLQLKQESMMTILHTRNSNIWLGLIAQKHLTSKSAKQMQHCILYSAKDGNISEDGRIVMRSGNGYRIGERVGVTFSSQQGLAMWTINCRFKCQHSSQRLKDATIKWVPVIAMQDRGDIVMWEQQSLVKL